MTTTPEMIDLLIEARWIAAVAPDVVLKNHAVAVTTAASSPAAAGEARSRFKASRTRRA
jgi:5-methylthioadenosine/S-adenosylhomocysteine deaminase